MPSAANDSFIMPQPVSGLAIPARVYITVSRSGQMCSPQRSKSSAVFTTTERSPDGTTASRPAASFAPPTPPASASTFTLPSRLLFAQAATEPASRAGGVFEGVGRDGNEAEGVGDLAI